jgi:hypothetical protein
VTTCCFGYYNSKTPVLAMISPQAAAPGDQIALVGDGGYWAQTPSGVASVRIGGRLCEGVGDEEGDGSVVELVAGWYQARARLCAGTPSLGSYHGALCAPPT